MEKIRLSRRTREPDAHGQSEPACTYMLCAGFPELIESRHAGTAPKDDPQLCVVVCLFVLRGLESASASLIRQRCRVHHALASAENGMAEGTLRGGGHTASMQRIGTKAREPVARSVIAGEMSAHINTAPWCKIAKDEPALFAVSPFHRLSSSLVATALSQATRVRAWPLSRFSDVQLWRLLDADIPARPTSASPVDRGNLVAWVGTHLRVTSLTGSSSSSSSISQGSLCPVLQY